MPSGVFQPYSGVGTAILVFTKGGKTQNVWFYDMRKDGYSLDQKREFIDGKGDIPEVVDGFRKRQESKQSIFVPFEKIKLNDYNLSYSRYCVVTQENVIQEMPDVLIEKASTIEQEILSLFEELKSMLRVED